jgi:hypothetical protein
MRSFVDPKTSSPSLPVPRLPSKYRVAPSSDAREQEADRIADRVLSSPGSAASSVPVLGREQPELVQRKCADCEEEEMQRKESTPGAGPALGPVGAPLASRIDSARGAGTPLPETVRADLEPRLGLDFSGVRVHSDGSAAALSRDLGAAAFTVGPDVFFANGRYAPETREGKRLLAHELVHTAQQGATPRRPGGTED